MNERQTTLLSAMSIHDVDLTLAVEEIAELRREMKRDAIVAQKAGDDYSATKLRNAANLLIKAERELSGALKGSI